MPPSPREHLFECQLTWTGAAAGGTVDYAPYSRAYQVDFVGKPSLLGSGAPAFRGDPSLYNPEDLLVASLSSCHCLSYLALAARAGVVVTAYHDQASGVLAMLDGKLRFREVTLRPRVTVRKGTDEEKAQQLHKQAHQECFIASSVNFPVGNQPSIVVES
jgi:organic hydroperoxide reductase OsmC/OhrA